MVEMNIEIKGLDEVMRKLGKAGAGAQRELAAALYEEAQGIRTESLPEVPVDTGTLRGSGTVTDPEIKGKSVLVQMGYGGAASEYAMKVHEDLKAYHKVGKAKYLEDPVNRRSKGMGGRIAGRLRIVLKRELKS